MGKLIIGDLSVTVLVNLLDDLRNNFFIKVLAEGENLFDFVNGDGTTAVFVEHFESSLKLIIRQQILFIEGGYHELGVLDLTVAVSVNLVEHVINFFVGQVSSEILLVSFLDFVLLQLSVTVEVHGSEDLIDLLLLVLG